MKHRVDSIVNRRVTTLVLVGVISYFYLTLNKLMLECHHFFVVETYFGSYSHVGLPIGSKFYMCRMPEKRLTKRVYK